MSIAGLITDVTSRESASVFGLASARFIVCTCMIGPCDELVDHGGYFVTPFTEFLPASGPKLIEDLRGTTFKEADTSKLATETVAFSSIESALSRHFRLDSGRD
jgi:hypothetical protein